MDYNPYRLTASRWPGRLHLGLTVLLLLGLLAVGSLGAAGRLRWGSPPAAAVAPETRAVEMKGTPDKKSEGGRYRIEPLENVRQLLTRSGAIGFFGQPLIDEAWVFKFTGGYFECKLETDFDGKAVSAGTIPDDWPNMLRRDEENIKSGKSDALQREGTLILAVMQQGPFERLVPYFPHLGGLFGAGPAGILHPLTALSLDAWHRRAYRVFVSVGPPEDSNNGRFNLWTEQMILLRQPFIHREPAPDDFYAGGGKDVVPGREITIFDRPHGTSRLRLKARFLGDGEVATLAAKKEAKP